MMKYIFHNCVTIGNVTFSFGKQVKHDLFIFSLTRLPYNFYFHMHIISVLIIIINLKSFQKLFGTYSSTGVDSKFHFTDFLINFLHKMNHKVD